jgi:hypothetical protein
MNRRFRALLSQRDRTVDRIRLTRHTSTITDAVRAKPVTMGRWTTTRCVLAKYQ